MADTIVVIAAGEMGAGIGKRLSERGARVLTSLKGRGSGSVARAQKAGMTDVADDNELVAQADFILSVVPPGGAMALAERFRAPLTAAARKPVYIDCNAVAPKTAEKIGAVISATGARFIDCGIVGGPPAQNYSPSLYVSGPAMNEARRLAAYGLTIRTVEGGLAAASALKMSYAGITKGFTAIGAAMMLGAWRAGCGDELRQELSESQPQLHAWLTRQVPRMYPKAYRWVAEMEEIAAFLGEDEAARDMYLGIARLYERVAQGEAKESAAALRELDALSEFCASPAEWHGKTG
jgi:3-hydroxyisobutyrate dehydrogenase-like beta-hydroxyacid dehydrogenase